MDGCSSCQRVSTQSVLATKQAGHMQSGGHQSIDQSVVVFVESRKKYTLGARKKKRQACLRDDWQKREEIFSFFWCVCVRG